MKRAAQLLSENSWCGVQTASLNRLVSTLKATTVVTIEYQREHHSIVLTDDYGYDDGPCCRTVQWVMTEA
jgi:hypothetical protein